MATFTPDQVRRKAAGFPCKPFPPLLPCQQPFKYQCVKPGAKTVIKYRVAVDHSQQQAFPTKENERLLVTPETLLPLFAIASSPLPVDTAKSSKSFNESDQGFLSSTAAVTSTTRKNEIHHPDCYLYTFKESGRLYQPVYLRRRDDLNPGDCTRSQLKFKAGDVKEDER